MDQLDQDLTRFKNPAMAMVGGVAAALVVATLPSVYLEKIIGMTGLAEILPAAAPPLGNTAKSLLALFAGLVSTSIIFYFLHRKGDADMGLAIRKLANWEEEKAEWEERKSKPKKGKFSFKKLLQKPRKKKGEVKDLSDLPNLREKDSHPDAPARQPIFAEKDLGAPLEAKIKSFEGTEPAAEAAEPEQAQPAPEITPAPFIMDKTLQQAKPQAIEAEEPIDLSGQLSVPPAMETEPSTVAEAAESEPAFGIEPEAPVTASVPADRATVIDAPINPAPFAAPQPELAEQPEEDLSGLSIAELTDRLESGLKRLAQLQQTQLQPPAQQFTAPVAPVQPQEPLAGKFSAPSVEQIQSAPPVLKTVEPTQEDIEAKRQADMDAALKAALGTLEKMTAQR